MQKPLKRLYDKAFDSQNTAYYGMMVGMGKKTSKSRMVKGADMLIALSAYLVWGVLPVYWKQVKAVAAMEILVHRILWSLVFLVVFIAARKEFKPFIRDIVSTFRDPKRLLLLVLAAFFLNLNWLVYIWAVNHNQMVYTSLGYYINPILSVIFGQILLKECLNAFQWGAFCIVIIGVLWLIVQTGALPWVSLVLAVSFALYGLIKKKTPVPAVSSLTMETFVSSFPALGYWVWLVWMGQSEFVNAWNVNHLYLLGAGIVTAVPLILFNLGAKRLPLYVIGLFQYITPTMTLLTGVLWYKEPFSSVQLTSFVMIWAGLLLFFLFTYRR